MPKVFNFNVDDEVEIVESINGGLDSLIGKKGIIKDLKENSNYDYVIRIEGESTDIFVYENELRKLNEYEPQVGDFVRIKATGEKGFVLEIDLEHNQLELGFEQGMGVEDFDRVELIERKEDVEMKNTTNADLHKQILDEIHDTYKRKNADYGNSFEEQYKEYGLLSSSIRLDDKIRRFKQLLKQAAQVKDESVRDTLMDLANYAIMTVMELDKEI